jgi:hypothetical protein
MTTTTNPQLQLAHDFVQFTDRNVFLTGKAGTGKTTFLHNLRKSSPKRMVVVAPTGVAAINAGGVTIHSMFQLPFGPIMPDTTRASSQNHRFSHEKVNIIKSMDLLVIDEISMVRADLLDGIDGVLRTYRHKDKPFGGVQLLMIGDLQQLAPVVKDDEWQLLKPYYDTPFFFSSRALKQTTTVNVELTHIYRQTDSVFINLLNKIRLNQLDNDTIDQLNKRCIPGFAEKAEDGYIILTTHNHQAKSINSRKLEALNHRTASFKANVSGEFPEYSYPTDVDLTLKTGAQIMFVKNDASGAKQFYNGKIGKIEKIVDDVVHVRCPNETSLIEVTPQVWQNMKYTIDDATKEITESEIGKFEQLPLKLAWAITIHKSQGLTFEKAVIDAGSSFAHGQVYVALSRCKTLEGMVLNTPITPRSLHNDTSVQDFTSEVSNNQPTENQLIESKHQYQQRLLKELFDLGTLKARLAYCHRQTGEHENALHGSMTKDVAQMQQSFKDEMIDVADKFTKQIGTYLGTEPDIDQNSALQERISRASAWFADKTEQVLASPLAKTSVISDNKAIKKTVSEALIRLKEEVKVKLACFKACSDGFEVKKYLSAKAKSVLEPVEVKTAKAAPSSSEAQSLTIINDDLYAQLKTWRNQKAAENDWPVYMILPTETIAHLCNQLPITAKELRDIKGFGKKKMEQYGLEIVEMITAYRLQKGIETHGFNPLALKAELEAQADIKEKRPRAEKEKKEPKEDTKKISFDLFEQGIGIDEIAAQRGFTNNTIEGHLAHYVELGTLDIHRLLSAEKLSKILAYYATNQPQSLTEAKIALGEDVSYGDIKLALASATKKANTKA